MSKTQKSILVGVLTALAFIGACVISVVILSEISSLTSTRWQDIFENLLLLAAICVASWELHDYLTDRFGLSHKSSKSGQWSAARPPRGFGVAQVSPRASRQLRQRAQSRA